MTVPDPETATYYRVQMMNRSTAFNVTQAVGDQLCEKLAGFTNERHVAAFVRFDDMSGADCVLNVAMIEGVYFSTPEQRAFDKTWNAAVTKAKDWSAPE